MGAAPVPPKRSEAEPTPLPNPSHPRRPPNPHSAIQPPTPCHSDEARPDTAFAKSRQFAIPQPRSGARIQLTAQAVGSCWHVAPAPKGERNARESRELLSGNSHRHIKIIPNLLQSIPHPPEQPLHTPPTNHPDPQKQRRPPGRRLDRELTTAYYFLPLNISTTLS